MNTYRHLTIFEREKIMLWHEQGKSINYIAFQLNRHKSTVSRELKRNTIIPQYSACLAQVAYHQKRLKCRRTKKLDNLWFFECVRSKFLEHQWSPEQIQYRLKKENSSFSVSYSTLYREIYAGRFNEKGLSHGAKGAVRKLRHRGKTRNRKGQEEKRGKIVISHPLTERPLEADKRLRLGDWEADTVLGTVGDID
ncbi:IS30 family transposase [Budvicia aquatica]|uniref:IS30 family transposase n=1 Tax=Budvicia aquatica TaxID=82979 RepID=UPI0021C33B79|nr:IS30 family transposase [Budvicia aquatica]